MTPVKSLEPNSCWQSCAASLLDLPAEYVPNVMLDRPDRATWERRQREFLATLGLMPVNLSDATPSLDELLSRMELFNPHAHYILGGMTAEGVPHAVVAHGGAIVFDPNSSDPEGHTLVGPIVVDDCSFFALQFFAYLTGHHAQEIAETVERFTASQAEGTTDGH